MQKNSTVYDHIFKIMRITGVQLIVAVMFTGLAVAHDNHAQGVLNREVSLNLKEVTLEQALIEIGSSAQVKFGYSPNKLKLDEKVTIEASNKKLGELLEALLAPRSIKYTVQEGEDYIVLTEKNESSALPLNEPQPERLLTTISGKVTNSEGIPMPGVNVVVRGTINGVSTDADGNYRLEVNENDVLMFSFIGFKTVEVTVTNQIVINVSMAEDNATLGEVVIYSTGYDQQSPEKTTGSFSHIGKDLLERNVGPDLTSRLNGVTPSLLIDQRSGSRTNFNIRGLSTILANDQPLIVVDNFPYNGELNTINPNDIESITILRDAAAASIWGVRAGNGVIVITTKKGQKNRPLQVGINTNITIGQKPDLFYENKMSTSDFIDVEEMLFDNGYFDASISNSGQPPVSPVIEILLKERNSEISEAEANAQLDALRKKDVRNDIQKYFYQKSVSQQYAINLNGGSENHSYYFSTGLDKMLSNRVGNDNTRITLNGQYTFVPIKNLEVSAGLVYTQSKSEIDNTLSSIRMSGGQEIYPYAQLTNDEGDPIPIVHDYRAGFAEEAQDQGFLDWRFNPIQELSYTDNTSKLNNIRATGGISYAVLDGLNVQFKYQYEKQSGNSRALNPVESYSTRNMINRFSSYDGVTVTRVIPEGGILYLSNSDLNSRNGRFQVNYNKHFNIHSISALAGIEARETVTEGYSNQLYGYDSELGSSYPMNYNEYYQLYPSNSFSTIDDGSTSVSGTIDRFRSYFANAAYTYNDKYTLSMSGRIDQSNLFGVNANQRSSPLWSVGGKWSIDQESFYKITWLPSLNLRTTYGYNGNIDQGATAFTTASFIQGVFSGRPAAFVQTPPNADLTWEKSRMLNIALDFQTRSNVLSGSIEYYNKKGVDLFGFGPLDPTSGLTTYKGNIANMKGQGWDIELNSININRKIKWYTTFLFSYTTDEVTKYKAIAPNVGNYFVDGSISRGSYEFTPTEGRPMFGIYSYKWAGLDPDNGDPLAYVNGEPSNNYTALGNFTVDSLKYHGRATPPVFGALRNTIKYQRWTLSFNVTYRFGYYFRRPSINYSDLYATYTSHGDFAKRWQEPGDELSTNVPSMVYPSDSPRDAFYLRSEILVEKGDNIRLQDIQLSYELSNVKLGNVVFRQIQLYSYINNVGILWRANKVGIDPDAPNLPFPRTFAFGARIGF